MIKQMKYTSKILASAITLALTAGTANASNIDDNSFNQQKHELEQAQLRQHFQDLKGESLVADN